MHIKKKHIVEVPGPEPDVNDPQVVDGTSDDNSGEGNFARLIFTPAETTEYYIVVGANLRGESAGTYTLIVRETTARDNATANIGTSAEITVDAATLLTGTFEQVSDIDWYKVRLLAGAQYRFDALGRNDNPTVSSQGAQILGIRDSDGDRVDGTAQSGGVETSGGNSRFFHRSSTTGDYFVEVGEHPRYHTASGTYKIAVSTDADDFTNSTTRTGTMAVGNADGEEGEIESRGDRDWIKISGLVKDQNYVIRVVPSYHAEDGPISEGGVRISDVIRYANGAQTGFDWSEGTTESIGCFNIPNWRDSIPIGTIYAEVASTRSHPDGWELINIGGYKVTVETGGCPTGGGGENY